MKAFLELSSQGNKTYVDVGSINAIHERGNGHGTEIVAGGVGLVVDQPVTEVINRLLKAMEHLDG